MRVWFVLYALGILCLSAFALCVITLSFAKAHDAPLGWAYDYECCRRTANDRTGFACSVFIAVGFVLDVAKHRRALFSGKVDEGVKARIHVQDFKLVACGKQGHKRTGFARAGVTYVDEFGKAGRLVGVKGWQGNPPF